MKASTFKYIAREVPVVVRRVSPMESTKYDVLFIMQSSYEDWKTYSITSSALHLHTRKHHKVYLEYVGFDDYELLYAFGVQLMSPTEFSINYSLHDPQFILPRQPLPNEYMITP